VVGAKGTPASIADVPKPYRVALPEYHTSKLCDLFLTENTAIPPLIGGCVT
jgi:hypothetical protein